MMNEVEICAVSGYSEVGRNMTAVRVDDEVVIIDLGISIPALVNNESEEQGRMRESSPSQLIKAKVIPDDTVIKDWKGKVKAIVLGHGHYDHIAAVRYLASKYKCPVYGTPFTIQILRTLLKDEEASVSNPLVPTKIDTIIEISKKLKIELISMSHSTLQCAMVAIHTPKGVVLYANDFKFDDDPVLGYKPNWERLKRFGKEGNCLVLITECMNVEIEGHTPTEGEAREKMKEVLLNTNSKGKALFVTTFSSQFARIKSIIEFGKKLNRRIVILGRSMYKYDEAAESLNLVNFSKDAEIIGYGGLRRKKLKEINENRGDYLVITTGSQGEKGSVLDKIVDKQLPFYFKSEDIVVFACRTIPTEVNIKQRAVLEGKLKDSGVKMFFNIHSSGHASKEDLKDFIKIVKPKNLIPSQGEPAKEEILVKEAEALGLKKANIHLVKDGTFLKF